MFGAAKKSTQKAAHKVKIGGYAAAKKRVPHFNPWQKLDTSQVEDTRSAAAKAAYARRKGYK